MKVLEISNLDYKWALGVSINDLSKPYRELNPIPNERDYYICTFGTFENISVGRDFGAIERMWSNIKSIQVTSPKMSGSKYKIKDGTLYRFSDHWGKVASCRWDLTPFKNGWSIGKIKITNLKPMDHCTGYFDYVPNAEKTMIKVVEILENYLDSSVRIKPIERQTIERKIKLFNYHIEQINEPKNGDTVLEITTNRITPALRELLEYCKRNKDKITEADYNGKEVPLNKPMRGDVKKFKVYVKNPKTGQIIKVNFGDPNMEIKRDNPQNRKNFRSRHNCANKTDKTTAGYWSCKMWSNKKVSDIV